MCRKLYRTKNRLIVIRIKERVVEKYFGASFEVKRISLIIYIQRIDTYDRQGTIHVLREYESTN